MFNFKFRRDAGVLYRLLSLILVEILKLVLVKILKLKFCGDADFWLKF